MNLHRRAGTIPNTNLVNPALVEGTEISPCGFRRNIHCCRRESACTYNVGARQRTVSGVGHHGSSGLLEDSVDSVCRDETDTIGRCHRCNIAIHVESGCVAIVREREMSPLAGLQLLTCEVNATRINGRFLIFTVCASLAIDTDAEVGADIRLVVGEGGCAIHTHTLDNHLIGLRLFGAHPTFDGELLKKIRFGADAAARLGIIGDGSRFHTWQVKCLTTVGIAEVERIRGRFDLSHQFNRISLEVVVGIVTFVLFEGEHPVAVDATRAGCINNGTGVQILPRITEDIGIGLEFIVGRSLREIRIRTIVL